MDYNITHEWVQVSFTYKKYITVMMPEEVLIYDRDEERLWASGQSILTRWRSAKQVYYGGYD